MLVNHTDKTVFKVILYEGQGAALMKPEQATSVLMALLEKGYAVSRVTPGNEAPAAADSILVLGEFPDGAPQVEDVDGKVQVETRDIGGLEAEAVLSLVEETRGDRSMNQPDLGAEMWKPWFPVIDYDRCTNCMQCLSFCLFDVYGVDDGNEIQVQNNDNCKTNCPACSRVCPEVAIMFPKYAAGPINGEEVREEDLSREKMKVDISALLGGDIYKSLRDRSEAAKSRFGKERDSGKALNERKRCLTKLVQAGDIPMDVLESLPSPEEIMKKAEEAAAKAQAALDAQKG